MLGTVLVVYAGLGLRAARFVVPAGAEPALTSVIGLLNGLVTGVTGTFVVPIVMYLEALGLDRGQLVQMMGIAFSVSTAALALALILHGAHRLDAGYVSAAAVAPAVAGMVAGARVRAWLTPSAFRKWLLAALGLLDLKLLVVGQERLLRLGRDPFSFGIPLRVRIPGAHRWFC